MGEERLTNFNIIPLYKPLATWYYPLMNKETTMTIGDLIGGILFTAIMFGFAFAIAVVG